MNKIIVYLTYALAVLYGIFSATGLIQTVAMIQKYGYSYQTTTIIGGIETTRTITATENLFIFLIFYGTAIVLFIFARKFHKTRKEIEQLG